MKRKIKNRFFVILLLILMIAAGSFSISAEENNLEDIPDVKSIAFTFGRTYDPDNDIDFYMMSGFIMYDYEKIWKHKAPDSLRFKIEGSLGAAHENKTRLVTSVNMFALYYLDYFETRVFKPYIEGGIGIIYTDFQVKGQGLRLNFNPQMGLGTEIRTGSEHTMYLSLRLHHISNAGLDDDNRGVNSVMCMLGVYF